ncbi:hypothetical protein, partial [Trinickia symbiotica]|uniref:hypothetical protein n=1 Tax=Trinickia symbiotica TaxID=863227 RepID=UPI001E53922A
MIKPMHGSIDWIPPKNTVTSAAPSESRTDAARASPDPHGGHDRSTKVPGDAGPTARELPERELAWNVSYPLLSGVNYNRRRRQLKLPPYAATGADAVGFAPAA